MQHRIGPNVQRPVRPAAEPRRRREARRSRRRSSPRPPTRSSTYVAPILAVDPVVPGLGGHPVRARGATSFGDTRRPLQLTDLPVAVLYVLAVTSIGVYGIVLAGWSSGSIYALLGGLRSSAQVISLRGRDGPVVRRGVHVRRLDVDVGDRRGAGATSGSSSRCSRRSSSTSSRWSARPTAPRSTSPRPRASWSAASTPSTRRSSSRCSSWPSTSTWSPSRRWPRRCSSAAGARRSASRRSGRAPTTGYWPVLWFFGKTLVLHLHVRLAARHAAAHALRPVHALRLEVLIPISLGWIVARRVHPQAPGRGHARPAARCSSVADRRRRAGRCIVVPASRRRRGARARARARGVRRLRRRLPGPADARASATPMATAPTTSQPTDGETSR